MRESLVFFLSLVCITASTACVESKGKAGGFTTGVDPATRLDALTPAEATTICTAAADHVGAFVERSQYQDFVCRLNALMSSIGDATNGSTLCEAAYSACISDLSITVGPSDPCEAPLSCAATVAELEQCMRDQTSANSSINIPRCSEVNFDTATPSEIQAMLPDEPTSCADLDTECPGAGELIDPNVEFEGVDL